MKVRNVRCSISQSTSSVLKFDYRFEKFKVRFCPSLGSSWFGKLGSVPAVLLKIESNYQKDGNNFEFIMILLILVFLAQSDIKITQCYVIKKKYIPKVPFHQ